jgi:hypothetical protein
MLPPFCRSIVGNAVVSRTSPATTTSERRNITKLSPSACARGWCSTSMASPFRYMYLRPVSKVSVGHAVAGNGDACPVGALIRKSTFSLARMDAAPLCVIAAPRLLPMLKIVRPARATVAFPPTWSTSAPVLMT